MGWSGRIRGPGRVDRRGRRPRHGRYGRAGRERRHSALATRPRSTWRRSTRITRSGDPFVTIRLYLLPGPAPRPGLSTPSHRITRPRGPCAVGLAARGGRCVRPRRGSTSCLARLVADPPPGPHFAVGGACGRRAGRPLGSPGTSGADRRSVGSGRSAHGESGASAAWTGRPGARGTAARGAPGGATIRRVGAGRWVPGGRAHLAADLVRGARRPGPTRAHRTQAREPRLWTIRARTTPRSTDPGRPLAQPLDSCQARPAALPFQGWFAPWSGGAGVGWGTASAAAVFGCGRGVRPSLGAAVRAGRAARCAPTPGAGGAGAAPAHTDRGERLRRGQPFVPVERDDPSGRG
ncbi:hypothetical protein CLV72_103547 [Allonocardiopsis opalescens]|uniref:Uncharacterized protein n=1 Tax=Allonocardiopsis opalescens TaxID=1144618 RepID=A0A2T0Q7W0_9ACTN|nr:hypothetical protein CLV72_103547 [Allonocardiopsis opalescens]